MGKMYQPYIDLENGKFGKKCRECGEVKELTENFYTAGKDTYADGTPKYRSMCGPCHQQWRLARPSHKALLERVNLARKALLQNKPLEAMLNRKRAACFAQGKFEWSLTLADFPEGIPLKCPVLGIVLDPPGSATPQSPSFDRLDSTKGYIPGNVRIISHRANQIKSAGTADEHEKIAAWMRSKGVG